MFYLPISRRRGGTETSSGVPRNIRWALANNQGLWFSMAAHLGSLYSLWWNRVLLLLSSFHWNCSCACHVLSNSSCNCGHVNIYQKINGNFLFCLALSELFYRIADIQGRTRISLQKLEPSNGRGGRTKASAETVQSYVQKDDKVTKSVVPSEHLLLGMLGRFL